MEIKCFEMGSFGANCYLVKTQDAAVVIDPFNTDARIADFFNDDPTLERYVLLTHCHFDHILGAKKIRELFGAKIAIGEYDANGLYDTDISLSDWVGLKQELFEADIPLKDGETLKIGNTEIEVIHTPGHTAGSVCYKIKDALFTGDTLFKLSVGRTDFPTGDYGTLMQSLQKIKDLFANDTIVYPGHGEATTMQNEIANNPYM